MATSRRKWVNVELRMDAGQHADLERLVQTRMLGDTLDDVVAHLLRQHLFEECMRANARAVFAEARKEQKP